MTEAVTLYTGGPASMTSRSYADVVKDILGFHKITVVEDEDEAVAGVKLVAAEKGEKEFVMLRITVETYPHPDSNQHIG